MEIKDIISTSVDKFIDDTFPKDTVRSFLKNHERRHILESNLLGQIKKADHVIKEKETIEGLVNDFARTFCDVAIKVKTRELTSGIMLP